MAKPRYPLSGRADTQLTGLMAAVQTAMIGRMPYTALRHAIYAHPTTAEGLTFLLRSTPVAPAR